MIFPGERSTLSSEAAALARSRRENSPEMGWSEMAVAPSGGVKWTSMVVGRKIAL